jgi:hypothetical protein
MRFFCFSANAGDAIKAAAPQQLNRIKRLFFTIFYSSFFPAPHKRDARKGFGFAVVNGWLPPLFVFEAAKRACSQDGASRAPMHLPCEIVLLIKNRKPSGVSH